MTGFLGKVFGIIGVTAVLTVGAQAEEPKWHTTSSLTGQSKYGEDFKRYDYVNPDAPKGGTLNAVAPGTFDSFNPFIVRGTPAAGLNYQGGLLYDTLMAKATDEGSTSHPLIAEAYSYPDDFSSATYRLDPRAMWHDGTPVTVEDVIWSFNFLKETSQQFVRYFANVTEAVKISDREVQFRFDQKGNRELPLIMGDVVVLPKHWWEGTDANGKKRDITQPSLEIPLGSGAYRIDSFKPGSEVVWSRVEDYWGEEVAVNVGRNNFDRRRYIYILDDTAAWEAFKKGGLQDIRPENRSSRWATEYNFPAVAAGDVVKRAFADTSGQPMQAFALNTRRPQFQDRRVRKALTYAFDFETMNRTLFYDAYTRTDSYFEGSELASSGLPAGRELEILEKYRDKLPPELFTEPFTLPAYDTPTAGRDHLRTALKLFAEAGWVNKGGKLVNEKTGEPFKIEFLGDDPTDERVTMPFIQSLRRLGIETSLRIVDPSQYVNRTNDFDYDAVSIVLSQSSSPGNEQREYWGSKAADTPGTRNLMGIKDPVVDALVERVIFATDRDDLLAATHALDRVLLWNYYAVPQWHKAEVWIAYWNKFGIPEPQPSYIGADLDSWWIDPEKEKILIEKYKSVN
ncbi:ABC transporter substrate-binding protein [Mesorhizobium sp. NBSH29]|uniref:extracellular solute-binding protein n=1 Tax=Mesorhizobium sp. NBSH29 TaxID=2654249 RepID=UPI00189694A2|nr:extracellular solute-binding protein [Mesorhizobium sp. NBSH29]QPC86567.1 ABC transporter substrate-binding protein [Mesorhizobium sp. NBSH29]